MPSAHVLCVLHFTCWTSCFKCLCAGALPAHRLSAPCTGQASPQCSSWHCCRGVKAGYPGQCLLHSGCTFVMILLDIPRDLHPPPLQTGSLLYLGSCSFCSELLFALEKHTHRPGVQPDSCGSTFKVPVKPGYPAQSHCSPQLQLPIPSLSWQHWH